MSLSTALKSVAAKIITSQGQEVTFTQETSTAFDAGKGKNVTKTTTFTGNGVVDKYKRDEIDGTVIQTGDILLVLEATDDVPVNGDTCIIDAIVYRVMGVLPVSPAGTVIIYEVQLRA